MSHQDEHYMHLAIEKARQGIEAGQTPFGACIVRNGEVISCEHNTVWLDHDITSHAEVHAIRVACQTLKEIDLSGATIYSTTEPCPMCFSAIHWARIDRIVYGTSIADAQKAGFNELCISNTQLKDLAQTSVEVQPGVLREENKELFALWIKEAKSRTY